ncbi:ABC transporter substrate-binding protein [Inmirania thermothiophila]|uniref:Peptide/nickel transport system substrate-binding protein n=1 Tax=Inmirania thermothiophila TaxID=1750597 RepID=A0A3N1XZW4_9GAMM|nr:ABC transporter substrate-binding protein [Inmirania thermothiophila]ROR32145.1 peptide/nickel transport system substrate-binding protein [Inmirania thermothiophila]
MEGRIATARARAGAVLGLALLLGACAGGDAAPRAIRLGIAAAPATLDPRFATDAASVRLVRLLYARLTDFDAAGRAVPALARWTRAAPTRYRFRLDPERRAFADGRRLTAADVVATYRSVLDPATGSPYRAGLEVIRAVEAVDEETVAFVLSRPDPLFPTRLGLGILPAAAAGRGAPVAGAPGSGPFRLLAREPGRMVLERRADGQRVELVVVPDPTVRVLKLLRGELDLVQNDLPPELVAYLRRRPEVRILRAPGTTFTYLGFNLEDPLTGRRALREAVARAIDREAIVRHLFAGAARPAEWILPPTHWAGDPGLRPYAHDPARARALVASLGAPVRLSYKTSADPFRLRVATVIQAQLRRTGIEVRIASHDWGTFYGDIKAGRFQMYSLSWVGVRSPEILRYIFHSASLPPAGANRGRYRSPRVDGLLDAAARAATLEALAPIYRAVAEEVHRDLAYVPLWYEDHVAALRAEVAGYRLSPDGSWDGLATVRRR